MNEEEYLFMSKNFNKLSPKLQDLLIEIEENIGIGVNTKNIESVKDFFEKTKYKKIKGLKSIKD